MHVVDINVMELFCHFHFMYRIIIYAESKELARTIGLKREYKLYFILINTRSGENIVGIATGYRLDYQGVGVRAPVGSRIFSSPPCADRFWGPPILLSSGYQG
jgi:hypothetical protein